jgi:outer membrane receptor protein involved in Fe transport
MRSICRLIPLAATLLTLAARGQAVPTATGPLLFLGVEYSNVHAGFPYQSDQRLWGIGAFADYHITSHFDAEAELRFQRFDSFYGETENNYLAGPRYAVRRYGKLQPFAQCLAGVGKIQYPFQIGTGSYLAVAPGAGADYRIASRWSLTGKYEYQFWPGSPGVAGEPAHLIAPSGFHVGVAFRVLPLGLR